MDQTVKIKTIEYGKKLNHAIEKYSANNCQLTEIESRADEGEEILRFLDEKTQCVSKIDIEKRIAKHKADFANKKGQNVKAWRDIKRAIEKFERACLDRGIYEKKLSEKENRIYWFKDVQKKNKKRNKQEPKKEISFLMKIKWFFDGMIGRN